jgi:hypothetical protein
VASIDQPLKPETKSGDRTISQLLNLLAAIDTIIEQPEAGATRPVYDQLNLAMAVRAAAENFHRYWDLRLGLAVAPGGQKEHWTRIKALSRRLGLMWQDEYDTLKPVAELRDQLQLQIYAAIQSPLRWTHGEPSDDEKLITFDAFAQAVNRRITELATRRLWEEQVGEWQKAYNLRGAGSTFVRARVIAEDVYDRAAPVPEPVPTPDRNRFWHDVISVIRDAAEETGVELA